ncbi:hypothetical protein HY483_00165 [Candidatus Woesearchaeota archaeon]|nr:hypothetical protein [Candidatus Woesearchaeota archaeon]
MNTKYSNMPSVDEQLALGKAQRSRGAVNTAVFAGVALATVAGGFVSQQSAYAGVTDTFKSAGTAVKNGASAVYDFVAHNRVSEKVVPVLKEGASQVKTFAVEQRDRTPGTSRDSDAGFYDDASTPDVKETFNDLSWSERMKDDGKSAVRNYSNIVRHVVGGADVCGDFATGNTRKSLLAYDGGSGTTNNELLHDQSLVGAFVEFGKDVYDISQSIERPGEKPVGNTFGSKAKGDLEAIVQNGRGVFESLTLGHDDSDDSKDTPGIVGGVRDFALHVVDAVKLKTSDPASGVKRHWLSNVGFKAAAPVKHLGSGTVELVSDTVTASFDVVGDTVAMGINVVSPVFRTTTLAGDNAGKVGDTVVKFLHDTNDVVTSPQTYVQTVDLGLDVAEASALIVEDAVSGTLELAHVPVEAALGWNKYSKHVSNFAKGTFDVAKTFSSTALDFQAHRAVVTPDFGRLADGHTCGLPVFNYWNNSPSARNHESYVPGSVKTVDDTEDDARAARSYRASLSTARKVIEIPAAVWAWQWVLDAFNSSNGSNPSGLGPNRIVGSQTGGNQVR